MKNIFEETKYILKKYGITANKSLGQNFLISDEAVEGIIEKSEVCKEDFVIEIGPGLGTLTKYLLDNAGKVLCIELDTRMIKILNDRFSLYENFELINEDVLKVDLKKVIEENLKIEGIKNVKVVANLPYYITTPIIMKLLEERLNIKSITVMVQKEVAERLAEKPGGKESGAITYSIAYYTDAKIVLNVGRECFVPSPEVDSAVIKLDLLKEPRVKVSDEKLFFKVVKASFMLKRKTLVNGLVNGKIFNSKQEAEECLNKLGIDLKIRGEKLTLEQFAEISEYVKSIR